MFKILLRPRVQIRRAAASLSVNLQKAASPPWHRVRRREDQRLPGERLRWPSELGENAFAKGRKKATEVDWINWGLGCSCVTEWHRIFGLHVTLPILPESEKVAALQTLTALLAIFRICLLSMPQSVTGMS